MLDFSNIFNIYFTVAFGALILIPLIIIITVAAKGKRARTGGDVFVRVLTSILFVVGLLCVAGWVLIQMPTYVSGTKIYLDPITGTVFYNAPMGGIRLGFPEFFAALNTYFGLGLASGVALLNMIALIVDCTVANKKLTALEQSLKAAEGKTKTKKAKKEPVKKSADISEKPKKREKPAKIVPEKAKASAKANKPSKEDKITEKEFNEQFGSVLQDLNAFANTDTDLVEEGDKTTTANANAAPLENSTFSTFQPQTEQNNVVDDFDFQDPADSAINSDNVGLWNIDDSLNAKDNTAPVEQREQEQYNETVEQETYGEPIAQETYGEPVEQETYGEPIAQETYGEPVEQETYGEPIDQREQEQYSEPVEQETYGEPIAQETYTAPIDQREQEQYSEPVEQETYTEPVEQETYGEPVAQEQYSEPIAQETYTAPIDQREQEQYSEPVEQETYGEPVAQEQYSEPIAQETYTAPIDQREQYTAPTQTAHVYERVEVTKPFIPTTEQVLPPDDGYVDELSSKINQFLNTFASKGIRSFVRDGDKVDSSAAQKSAVKGNASRASVQSEKTQEAKKSAPKSTATKSKPKSKSAAAKSKAKQPAKTSKTAKKSAAVKQPTKKAIVENIESVKETITPVEVEVINENTQTANPNVNASLPITRRYVILNRASAANVFNEYLNERKNNDNDKVLL